MKVTASVTVSACVGVCGLWERGVPANANSTSGEIKAIRKTEKTHTESQRTGKKVRGRGAREHWSDGDTGATATACASRPGREAPELRGAFAPRGPFACSSRLGSKGEARAFRASRASPSSIHWQRRRSEAPANIATIAASATCCASVRCRRGRGGSWVDQSFELP